jgi:hypothetical protein
MPLKTMWMITKRTRGNVLYQTKVFGQRLPSSGSREKQKEPWIMLVRETQTDLRPVPSVGWKIM